MSPKSSSQGNQPHPPGNDNTQYQRSGHVVTFPVSSASRAQILLLITKHTLAGSLYYTDDWHAYATLHLRGVHVVVDKRIGVPKGRGRSHINGIEGFWSYTKDWLYTYRGVQKDFFPLYIKEIEWRFNHRHERLFYFMVFPYLVRR